jgi:hypothetical protein
VLTAKFPVRPGAFSGEGFKRNWPPLIKMAAAVKAKAEKLFH